MEIWKDVIGYEKIYQVSNLGRVKSLFYNKQKILKPIKSTNGYLYVNLYKDKKAKTSFIHHVVYEAFYQIKSCRKNVIDHIDNNKVNNNLSNLQYITIRLNSTKDKKPKSGHSNIYLNSGSYLVRIRVNNQKISIGTFKKIEDAIIKRDLFIKKLNENDLY